jgi:acyl-coenzyme A thioesterase 9
MRSSETSREQVLCFSTDPELRRRYQVLESPIPANLRFGLLLEVLDQVAGECAVAYARHTLPTARIVTAALDEIVVRQPADVAQDIRCRARINHVGRTSMEVGVRVETVAEAAHLASCYFTMAAREGDGPAERGALVPGLTPGDELERARSARAVARRAAMRQEAEVKVEPPTREEFLLVADLYRVQEAPGFGGLRCADLVIETWERTYPEQDNPWKTIFGGYLMRRAYELSSICAERVSSHRPVLGAVNRIHFARPVQIGDQLHLTSRVVYTSGPAVCVETTIERISRDRTARALSNSCLFTFLNVDGALQPHLAAPVHPGSHAEEQRYLAARRNLRGLLERTARGWMAAALGRAAV